MKSKGFLIIIPLTFILIIAAILTRTYGIAAESILFKAFTESGAELVNSEMTFSGSGNNKLRSDNERTEFYIEVTEAIGQDLPVTPVKIDNDSFKGLEINNSNGRYSNYNLKILQSKSAAEPDKCYVTLYIIDNSSAPALVDIKTKVKGIFKKFGIKPSINTCLTGSYIGRLENNKLNEICAGIFKRTSARKVTGIRDNSLISVSAYSRAMRDSVLLDGKDVNLGFAARYNSYEDKTYIWLATPLITTEY